MYQLENIKYTLPIYLFYHLSLVFKLEAIPSHCKQAFA